MPSDFPADPAEQQPEVAEDAPPNAADAKEYARAVRSRRAQQREDREFWQSVMASQVGRRVVWALLIDCRTFDDIFAYGPNGFPDPQQSSFYRGQQQIGQRLWRTLMGYAPDALAQMHREYDPDVRAIALTRRK